MSTDKLVDADELNGDLTQVANAIRAQTGDQETLQFPDEFVTAIGAIPRMDNPLTTKGDIIYCTDSGTPGTPGRLGIGTAGQVLKVSSNGTPEWGTDAGGMSNPLQAVGDLIYCNAAGSPGTPARLAKGDARQVLAMNNAGTTPEWADMPSLSTQCYTGTFTLGTTWQGNDPYTQVITIPGSTASSIIELQPTPEQISTLQAAGVTLLQASNTNGTITVTAVGGSTQGGAPMSMQYLRLETNPISGTPLINPLVHVGDLIVCDVAATPGTEAHATNMGIGTAGQVLTVKNDLSGLEWKTPESGTTVVANPTPAGSTALTGIQIGATKYLVNPISAQGDLMIGGSGGAPTALSKGTEGYVLKAGATTISWEEPTPAATLRDWS